jgi:hypothetical protein
MKKSCSSSARFQLPAQAAAIPAAVLTGNPDRLQSHSAAIFSASPCNRPASARRPPHGRAVGELLLLDGAGKHLQIPLHQQI